MDGKTDGNSFQECAAPDSFSLFMFGKNSVHQMFSVAKIPQFYSHHMQKKSTLNFLPLVQLKKKIIDGYLWKCTKLSFSFWHFFQRKKIQEKKNWKNEFLGAKIQKLKFILEFSKL